MTAPAPIAAFTDPTAFYAEVDLAPYVALLGSTFGIPPEPFATFFGYKPNRETVWIVPRNARLPLRPAPFAAGLPFYYYRMRFPRPTTPTALRWGHLATRNVYDLADAELGPLIDYEAVPTTRLDPAEVPGYQLIRHRGRILGVALANFDEGGRVALHTLTPKVWRLRLDHLTPDQGEDAP